MLHKIMQPQESMSKTPFANIDRLVDAIVDQLMVSFMGGFSGYNQIKMEARVKSTLFTEPTGHSW